MKDQSTNVKSTEHTKDQFVELAKVHPSVYCLMHVCLLCTVYVVIFQ